MISPPHPTYTRTHTHNFFLVVLCSLHFQQELPSAVKCSQCELDQRLCLHCGNLGGVCSERRRRGQGVLTDDICHHRAPSRIGVCLFVKLRGSRRIENSQEIQSVNTSVIVNVAQWSFSSLQAQSHRMSHSM